MPNSVRNHQGKPVKIFVGPDVILALEGRGFCAALLKNGQTKSMESRTVSEFSDLISQSAVVWVDYVVDSISKEAVPIAKELGFSESLVHSLLKDPRRGYEDLGNEMGVLLPAMVVEGFDVKLRRLLILIRGNMIVTLHISEVKRFFRVRRYGEVLLRKLPPKMPRKDKITLLLIRLIEENNARNFDHLRDIEEHGDQLSHELADPKTPRAQMGQKIYQMKHALIIYLGGLWATVDVLNSLRYGDASLITDDQKLINRIAGLIGELNSQIGLAEHLSEVLASGLEVLQSIYNNQLQILNNRLAMLAAYLAIIGTALLVPNTIATIAGGSMFVLTPADAGWYVGLLAVLTITAVGITWYLLRRASLLPHSPE
jgi:magnesium transporter